MVNNLVVVFYDGMLWAGEVYHLITACDEYFITSLVFCPTFHIVSNNFDVDAAGLTQLYSLVLTRITFL